MPTQVEYRWLCKLGCQPSQNAFVVEINKTVEEIFEAVCLNIMGTASSLLPIQAGNMEQTLSQQ